MNRESPLSFSQFKQNQNGKEEQDNNEMQHRSNQ